MELKIVNIIPLQQGPIGENLTYFTNKNVVNGDIVSILLKNKKILGSVFSIQDVSLVKEEIKNKNFVLKKILEIKKTFFRKEFLESIFEISNYFGNKKNNGSILIPKIFLDNYDFFANIFLTSESYFSGSPVFGKSDLSSTLESLTYPKTKIHKPDLRTPKLLQMPLENRIEFYKKIIKESFYNKQSIFIVLPTQKDIENIFSLLSPSLCCLQKSDIATKSDLGGDIFYLHSKLSKKIIIKKLEKIITSTYPVLILGTANFLAIPRLDLGLVILENENSDIYKNIQKPYFDLRNFVELFALKIGAKLILGDSLLSLKTLAENLTQKSQKLLKKSFDINFDGEINIITPEVGGAGGAPRGAAGGGKY